MIWYSLLSFHLVLIGVPPWRWRWHPCPGCGGRKSEGRSPGTCTWKKKRHWRYVTNEIHISKTKSILGTSIWNKQKKYTYLKKVKRAKKGYLKKSKRAKKGVNLMLIRWFKLTNNTCAVSQSLPSAWCRQFRQSPSWCCARALCRR